MNAVYPWRLGDFRCRLPIAPLARFAWALCVAMLLSAGLGHAAILDAIGAMGDSGTAGGTVNKSWVPVLVSERGLSFGPGANSYNLAQGGATSNSLLNTGQHTALAGLVSSGDVTTVSLLIGTNDFGTVTGQQLAGGTLTAIQVQDFIDGRVANITTAADTVLAANPEGFILFGVPDVTLMPQANSLSPAQATRVRDAITAINLQLQTYALHQRITYIQTDLLMQSLLSSGPLLIGGVPVDVDNPGTGAFFFRDGIHPGAIGNGLIASLFIEALNAGYEQTVVPLNDFEILSLAGLESEYTGETFSNQVDFSRFIRAASIPEPGTVHWSLLVMALIGVTAVGRRGGGRRAAVAGRA